MGVFGAGIFGAGLFGIGGGESASSAPGIFAAWGADVRTDPSGWVWSDISDDVEELQYTIKDGRSEGATQAETLGVSPALEVRNPDGRYTPEDARSELWPTVTEGTPIWWVRDTVYGTYDLVQGFIAGLTPRWTAGNNRHKVVDIAVTGRLGLLNRGNRPLPAPLVRTVLAAGPIAYWPLTDGENADWAASGLPGGTPMTESGAISFAAVAGPPGAPASTPELVSSGAYPGDLSVPIAMTTATGWTIEGWFRAVADTSSDFGYADPVQWQTTGGPLGADGWSLQLSFDTGIFSAQVGARDGSLTTVVGFESWDESEFQGIWHQWRLSATQDGSNVRYQVWIDGRTFGPAVEAGSVGRIVRHTVARPGPRDEPTAAFWQSISVAHHVIWDIPAPPVDTYDAGLGWPGETPSQRIVRLGAEEGFPVTVDRGITDLADEFNRTVSPGWGDADTGETYTNLGSGGTVSASDWEVDGGIATHSVPVALAYRFSYASRLWADMEVLAQVRVPAAAGGDLEPTIMLRVKSSIDYYMARVRLLSDGTVQAQLRKIVANVDTGFTSLVVPDLTHDPATPLWIRAQIIGSRLRMRVWAAGEPELAVWHATGEDSTHQGVGYAGVRSGVGSGNTTPKPVLFEWLHLEVTDLADRLGAQPEGTAVTVLQDAELTGMGRLSERNWGVHYRPRSTLYNQTPALSLDVVEGHLGDPFTPKRDLTLLRNEVQVTRRGGSTATWTDPVTASRGVFQDTYTIGPQSDAALLPYAQARVAIGTVDGYRYPSLSTDLGRHSDLLAEWLALRLGDRVQVHGARLRVEHAEDLVDQLVEGRTQRVYGRHSWLVTLVTSPAAPWTVGVIEGTGGPTSPPWRLDASAEITQRYGAGESPLQVATTSGPLLSTDSDDYPCDVLVDGVPMRITEVTGASSPQTVHVTRGIDGWDRPLLPASAGAGRGQLELWRAARTAL